MHNDHTETICHSFKQAIEKQGCSQLGINMLNRFFERHPEASAIFTGINIHDFAASKFRIISDHILDSVKRPEHATYNMFCEIHRHRYLDINDITYHFALIEACRDAVEEALTEDWTPETDEHWNDVVHASKSIIQQAWSEAQASGL